MLARTLHYARTVKQNPSRMRRPVLTRDPIGRSRDRDLVLNELRAHQSPVSAGFFLFGEPDGQ